MPNEPTLPRDWAARMIPTLTEVVEDPGATEASAAAEARAASAPEAWLNQVEPELRRRVADAVSAALREQWASLSERVNAAVDRAVRQALADARERGRL